MTRPTPEHIYRRADRIGPAPTTRALFAVALAVVLGAGCMASGSSYRSESSEADADAGGDTLADGRDAGEAGSVGTGRPDGGADSGGAGDGGAVSDAGDHVDADASGAPADTPSFDAARPDDASGIEDAPPDSPDAGGDAASTADADADGDADATDAGPEGPSCAPRCEKIGRAHV